MVELIEFLRARLDAAEQVARAVQVSPAWTPTHVRYQERFDAGVADEDLEFAWVSTESIAAHIARHDPAYVLWDIESKRRIIARLEEADEWLNRPENRHYPAGEVHGLYVAVCLLAEPYSGHPDYRDEWRP